MRSAQQQPFRLLVVLLLLPPPCAFASSTSNSSDVNPYQSGCLKALLPGWDKERVCNSEDSLQDQLDGVCRQQSSPLDYRELRIFAANWETATFQAWLVQILLSEILDVPVTIETSLSTGNLNFYDKNNAFEYGSIAFWTGFETAAAVKDCRLLQQSGNPSEYQPCHHFHPELWYSDPAVESDIKNGVDQKAVDLPTSLGATAFNSIFVTRFSVDKDPTLSSYIGLQGEKNRQKLAETFLRPTTWEYYCTKISSSNCTAPDSVAQRPPASDSEAQRMFVQDLFTGHFRSTEENDCSGDRNSTCTGHIGDYPCGWNSYIYPQTYHLDIALKSNGEQSKTGAYEYQQLYDMWMAANATKNNLMMRWWSPDPLYQRFLGTDAEMFKVAMPTPSLQCLANRISVFDRCKDNATLLELVGDSMGVCDDQRQILRKLVSTAAKDDPLTTPEPFLSPGYQSFQLYTMSDLQLLDLLLYAAKFETPREAVCHWFVDNLKEMQQFIPPTYPRSLMLLNNYDPLMVAALVLGVVAILVVLGMTGMVAYMRNKPAILLAQVEFLSMILFGSLLIAVAGIASANRHTGQVCVAKLWLANVGNTLVFVPLIIKVQAINKLMQQSRRMKRVKLSKASLFKTVFAIFFLMIVYLTVWSIVDPPSETAEYETTGTITHDERTIYSGRTCCRSNFHAFYFANFGWQILLLLWAAFLALQNRRAAKRFNETIWLALLAYSSFILMLGQLILFMMRGKVGVSILNGCESVLYSLQAISTMASYFVPRVQQVVEDDRLGVTRSSVVVRVGDEDYSDSFSHQRTRPVRAVELESHNTRDLTSCQENDDQ
jgi:7 transmembrane sweet-taste receptor of 3 GCPR